MKNIIPLFLLACLAGNVATCYAKDISPQELEIKQLTQQLKEKKAALKEQKKDERLAKAKAAADKANARLAKIQAGN